MSLDDALALAEQLLADFESSGAQEESGLGLVWVDQLAHVLHELADAASAWRAGRACDRSAITETGYLPGGPDGCSPGRVQSWLAWLVRVRTGRASAKPDALVLSAGEAATVWQALADAGAWHGAFGDCAACVAAGLCAEGPQHEQIAVEYAALRTRLGGAGGRRGAGRSRTARLSGAGCRGAAAAGTGCRSASRMCGGVGGGTGPCRRRRRPGSRLPPSAATGRRSAASSAGTW
jgi:hypothetical protein